ncbi:bifunctional adenosylcobinamide kinase/adenosylcobinamide-phosphate guanylyltransferase [Sulfurisoma sediminicola]|uniref:Bifunctional adenosylcobalamin biosynthesis protein n=1 Tax=Sulfurisoma sediminicola TaxID=1381557 RepID=A0A497XK84_9PROT|nr:bifunctional adenosylcobinamide kinase/adenosylcobinamide-phosphate guanylyltransferase [Sulfurisoma sediminicola]RLJ68331.1 adenosylcobinamide kinase /adenosylcobinamide-phosphate guanylyltransferase [Sulfurisoma sediminicola]
MKELILGGARSGKSALALRRAEAFAQSGHAVAWLATAQALDAEMAGRIARHRDERPAGWRTLEEPLRLAQALHDCASDGACVVVDCLTLWLTNLMLAEDAGLLERETAALLAALPVLPGEVILVANEVGLGIVPDNALARRFRDEAGRLNQAVAALCERVTFVAAGLPLVLK